MKRWLVVILLIGSLTTLVAPVAAQTVCPGFNSRVNIGDFARTTSPALNIREAPQRNAERLRNPLEPGTLVEILEGPECFDGFTWWFVSAAGIEGWVAEGNPQNTFLSAPVDPNDATTGTFDDSTDPNPNPPLGTLDGRPGGGNYEEVCRNTENGVVGRASSFDGDYESGAVIPFTPFLNVLEVDTPAICVGSSFTADGAVVIAPDGSFHEPSVSTMTDFNGFTHSLVQLPIEAFFHPGLWRLGAAGFILDVDVRRSGPFALYTMQDGGQIVIGGLQPNERFIASGTADDSEFSSWFGAIADANGAFVMPLAQLPWFPNFPQLDTNFLYLSATQLDVVGQLGSFLTLEGVQVTHPDTGFNWYRIPQEYAAPLMREIVWGGQPYNEESAMNLLRTWTCPGASPIRLNPDENGNRAFVASDVGAQPIRSAPSVNAQILEEYQPGDFVVFNNDIACADNGVWWGFGDGWFMESQGGQYFWVQ